MMTIMNTIKSKLNPTSLSSHCSKLNRMVRTSNYLLTKTSYSTLQEDQLLISAGQLSNLLGTSNLVRRFFSQTTSDGNDGQLIRPKPNNPCTQLEFFVSSSGLGRALAEAQDVVQESMLLLKETRNEVNDLLHEVYGNRGHHLLDMAASSFDHNPSMQMRELILLLMIEVTREMVKNTLPNEALWEITKKQIDLTEIIELIYKTNLLHKTVANHNVGESRLKAEDWNIHYNNKLAILFGDFHVARAWATLGTLRSIDVNLLMSQGISDFTQGQFIMQTDVQLPNSSISSTPSSSSPTNNSTTAATTTSTSVHSERMKNENLTSIWEKRHYLMNASLPGYACQSISSVAGFNLFLQEAAFKFGRNFSLCWQILTEMEPFLSYLRSSSSSSIPSSQSSSATTTSSSLTHSKSTTELVIDLMSLPVLLRLNEQSLIVQHPAGNSTELQFTSHLTNEATSINNIDQLYTSIVEGPVIERLRSIKNRYADEALDAINCFTSCDASCALINILNAIKET